MNLGSLRYYCSMVDTGEPYQTAEYKDESEIPFEPESKRWHIDKNVFKVRGTLGRFKGLRCVQKTIVVSAKGNQTSRMAQKGALVQEAKILHFARHHHVVRLIHTFLEEEDEDQFKFAVIMDRADGNLQSYLKPGKAPNIHWFGCLISVICHIHALGIRHRDIKPSNILIKGDTVLLADFGISQMGLGKTMPTTDLRRNAPRSREYCAPEVDKGHTRGRSADIFSLGAVFLEMITAQSYPDGLRELGDILDVPFQSSSSYAKNIDNVHGWAERMLRPALDQGQILSVCRKMLQPDRFQRPSAEELDSTWSVISAADKSVACKCARDVTITKCNKLAEACRKGLEDEVKHLLEEREDPNAINAIHYAAERGSEAIVQALLDGGADVDLPNPVGQTALHCAARSGYDGVVKLLLQNKANVNAKDENDQTALQGAAAQGYEGIVKMLLESGADAGAEDLDGVTAVIFADRRGHSAVLKILETYDR